MSINLIIIINAGRRHSRARTQPTKHSHTHTHACANVLTIAAAKTVVAAAGNYEGCAAVEKGPIIVCVCFADETPCPLLPSPRHPLNPVGARAYFMKTRTANSGSGSGGIFSVVFMQSCGSDCYRRTRCVDMCVLLCAAHPVCIESE